MTMSTQLDDLLAQWANRHALTAAEIDRVRSVALGTSAVKAGEPDVEWMWDLLRPVTALLNGPHRLQDRLMKPYSRLA